MRNYLLKRLLMTVLVILVVMTFLSLLVHIVPGDAARTLLGTRATPEVVAELRRQMDLDKPAHIQVINFIWKVLHGSLGTDVFSGQPINRLVWAALPHTLLLAWTSLALAALLGIPLGVYSATHPNSWLDRIMSLISISFITVPSYLGGLILLLIFAVKLHWLPAIGVAEEGNTLDYIRRLILPAVALAITWGRLSGAAGARQPARSAQRAVHPRRARPPASKRT